MESACLELEYDSRDAHHSLRKPEVEGVLKLFFGVSYEGKTHETFVKSLNSGGKAPSCSELPAPPLHRHTHLSDRALNSFPHENLL